MRLALVAMSVMPLLLLGCSKDPGKIYEYYVEVDSPQQVLVSMSTTGGSSQRTVDLSPGRPFSENVRAFAGQPLSLVAQIHGTGGCVTAAIRRDRTAMASERSCGDYVVAATGGVAP